MVRAGTLGLPLALFNIKHSAGAPLPRWPISIAGDRGSSRPSLPTISRWRSRPSVRAEDEDVARAGSSRVPPAIRHHGRQNRPEAEVPRPVEELAGPEGALFFGRPEIVDKIIKLHEQMNIDRFELHTSHVGHDLTMGSIELFATKVAPLVRERSRTIALDPGLGKI